MSFRKPEVQIPTYSASIQKEVRDALNRASQQENEKKNLAEMQVLGDILFSIKVKSHVELREFFASLVKNYGEDDLASDVVRLINLLDKEEDQEETTLQHHLDKTNWHGEKGGRGRITFLNILLSQINAIRMVIEKNQIGGNEEAAMSQVEKQYESLERKVKQITSYDRSPKNAYDNADGKARGTIMRYRWSSQIGGVKEAREEIGKTMGNLEKELQEAGNELSSELSQLGLDISTLFAIVVNFVETEYRRAIQAHLESIASCYQNEVLGIKDPGMQELDFGSVNFSKAQEHLDQASTIAQEIIDSYPEKIPNGFPSTKIEEEDGGEIGGAIRGTMS